MKIMYSILCLALLIVGCKEVPKEDNSANDLFKKNSETVLKSISDWENETLDYSIFAENAVGLNTFFGAEVDSIMIQSDEAKAMDKQFLARYDFKFLSTPVQLLPGVNPDTKKPDGSVRYYGAWEVTLPATDSTEAKSGVIKVYNSLDFDENGKIIYSQGYGDYSGLMNYLNE
ncbi:hypothetical protein [uncultured Algibacter sp.]|uniref:hypothetical protein n=1 Tax=uncultured Algibacter sp. TaxID=298659 RepID=UPI00260EA632|nr:hypothetical protein [uncultured Algibacter sp.]